MTFYKISANISSKHIKTYAIDIKGFFVAIPEKLAQYVTEIGLYQAKWHDTELSMLDMRKLASLSDQQLSTINTQGLFKDDKIRTCRYIPGRKTPLTVDEIISLVTGNFSDHKNKRHNSKTDYKINWEVVHKRRLLEDFEVCDYSIVPLDKVKHLPNFHKHFPVHLIQRLSEMSDEQYNNIFSRRLLWNPYLSSERFGDNWIKNKEFVHNPEKLNDHKSCVGYNKKTKRTIRFKESALGYDFWNHIFWLARLSPDKWRKIERYNLSMFSTYDMVTYMNLSDETLQKISLKAMAKHIYYAFEKNIWNMVLKLDTLDDLAVRKYGKIYEDIKHYKNAPKLKEIALAKTLGWENDSSKILKDELSARVISMQKCVEILESFGIYWTENMSDSDLDKQYKKLAMRYHPDRIEETDTEDNEKFQELASAVNTLKKHITAKQVNKKHR